MSETEKNVVVLNPATLVFSTDAPTVEKEITRQFGGKEYSRKFTLNEAKSFEDMSKIAEALAVSRGNEGETGEKVAVQLFNGALDLYVRQRLVAQMETEVEGPAKIIDGTAKKLAAALEISVEEAREMVVSQRKAKGLSV